MDFLFTRNDILSFRSFWKLLLQLEEGNIFKKTLIFGTAEETVFFIFFQILPRMEVAFRFSEMALLKGSFILASGNGFPMLEIRCKPVLFDFFNS